MTTQSNFEIQFKKSNNFVLVKIKGRPTHQDISDCFDQIVNSSDFKPGMARIWEFSETYLSELDGNALKVLSHLSADLSPGMEKVKVAFVSQRIINMGTLRLFKLYRDNTPESNSEVKTFETMQEAEAWIV